MEVPRGHAGLFGEILDTKIEVDVLLHPIVKRFERPACIDFLLSQAVAELRLTAGAFGVDDEATCQSDGGLVPEFSLNQCQRQIDARRDAG